MKITEEARLESYLLTDSATLRDKILNLMREENKPLSASEIAHIMHAKRLIPYPVRQAVAPRLTELVDAGLVEVDGKTYDSETGRNVAVYKVVEQCRA